MHCQISVKKVNYLKTPDILVHCQISVKSRHDREAINIIKRCNLPTTPKAKK